MHRKLGTMVAALVACGGTPGDPFADASNGTTDSGGSSGAAGNGSSGASEGNPGDHGDDEGDASDSGAPMPPKLDVAGGDEAPQPGGGCQKIDFLFAIDASPSMAAEQAQLIAGFPGFVQEIEANVQGQDHHLMVVDVDAYPQYTPVGGNGFCEDGSCCNEICTADPDANWCNNEPCGDHSDDCDFTLGAGKSHDADWNPCAIDGGLRWMTKEQDDLPGTFACVAEVGTYGYFDETQAAAMLAAVAPELDEPGGCNEGFVRDDAILVVTLISDEEDLFSPGDPPDWYEALLAAKGGNADAIVVLGLVGDYGQPGSPCAAYDPMGTGAQDAVRLRAFVEAFGERGLLGSVCAGDYLPFFADAVEIVDVACDEFEPAG